MEGGSAGQLLLAKSTRGPSPAEKSIATAWPETGFIPWWPLQPNFTSIDRTTTQSVPHKAMYLSGDAVLSVKVLVMLGSPCVEAQRASGCTFLIGYRDRAPHAPNLDSGNPQLGIQGEICP